MIVYNYDNLLDDIAFVAKSGAKVGHIGASFRGRLLPYARVGTGKKSVIFTGGIHARESAGSYFLSLLYKYALSLPNLKNSYYFAPMLNPDGVELVSSGIDDLTPFEQVSLITLNGGSSDFSQFKANYRGVDLNNNFDALWGRERNSLVPSASGYIGVAPFSESESVAIRDFTLAVKPMMTFSFHTAGRVIYWNFDNNIFEARDYIIAEKLSKLLGYPLEDNRLSCGGYKDYCIDKLHIPSFTIELGEGKHPLSRGDIEADWTRGKGIIAFCEELLT